MQLPVHGVAHVGHALLQVGIGEKDGADSKDRAGEAARDPGALVGREELRHTIEKVSPDNTRSTGEIPVVPKEAGGKAENAPD